MDRDDENIRDAIVAGFKAASIDARNISVEVRGGVARVSGSVPTEEEKARIPKAAGVAAGTPEAVIDVRVVPVPPSDASSGEGRSPLTGTSAESAHRSRHQIDAT
jgi:BON domain